jgi:hypothetical protein
MPIGTRHGRLGLGPLARFGFEALWRRPGFINECTGCHQPMCSDDYVYTLPITNAKIARKRW